MPNYNGLQLQYGIQPVNARPVDYYLGPYLGNTLDDGISSANSQIPIGIRYESQKVHILVGSERTPYVCWYFGGTSDDDLKLYETDFSGSSYNTISRNSHNNLGTDNGNARKFLVVLEDGTITQDFIRNYEIFKPTDFTFLITGFKFLNNNSPYNVLMGPTGTTYQDSGTLFTMTYNGDPQEGRITFNSSSVGSVTPTTCVLDSPYINANSCGYVLKYPNSLVQSSSNTTYSFTLNVTGNYDGGDDVNRSSIYEIRFLNKYYYGQTSGNYSLNPFETSEFLQNSYVNVLSNNKNASNLVIECELGNFAYFVYPKRLGKSKFVYNDGSFSLWDEFSVGLTNEKGFEEEYYVYKSINSGQNYYFSVNDL